MSFSSAASLHGLKRAFPTCQGKRLFKPSEATQHSGRHRRPGAALPACPSAGPRCRPRGGGEGARSPGMPGGGRQRSHAGGSSWQAGAGAAGP